MPVARCSDKDFCRLVREHGVNETARRLKVAPQNVRQRRQRIERTENTIIARKDNPNGNGRPNPSPIPGRLHYEIKDGVVLVGSDAHHWPGVISTTMKCFELFCRELKPRLVIMNGDMLDGARISRHPPLGQWEDTPSLTEEIEATKEALGKYRDAARKSVIKGGFIWSAGNHDGRFEARLQQVAPEYARIHGMHLKDHYIGWEPCWSVFINSDVVVKHRFKGGIHASHNATMWAGRTMINGHLHSAKVTPFSDYNGDRYGVDCGMMADVYGPQFAYLEDNPRNWREAFCVLRFKNGRLLKPSLATVHEPGVIDFEGELVKV